MTSRTLEVWCFGERAGQLLDEGRRLAFTYDAAWIAGGRPPLSQSLPTEGDFGEEQVHAFFEGLLPEGELRRLLASRLGVSAGNEFSLLERIEDFCQALGIDSDHKYEREGVPGLADCFGLLRRVSRTPAADLPRLLDAWVLSFVAANHDAHGKNFSLLYRPDGIALAPVYDVLNTLGYRGFRPMDRKMAMQVGGEYRPDYVRRRHLERMIVDGGLGSAATRRRLRTMLVQAPAAIDDAHQKLIAEFWDHERLDAVVRMGHERVAMLARAVDEAP